MAQKRPDAVLERLTDMLIVQLCLANVPQHAIRKIAACQLDRVVRISKAMKAGRKAAKGE